MRAKKKEWGSLVLSYAESCFSILIIRSFDKFSPLLFRGRVANENGRWRPGLIKDQYLDIIREIFNFAKAKKDTLTEIGTNPIVVCLKGKNLVRLTSITCVSSR